MSRLSSHPRDTNTTPFSKILFELCGALGAKCAALVDREGETVDYGGDGEPFDIRIQAAEWRLILQRLAETANLCHSRDFLVRARRKSFFVATLPEGYALVIELARRATGASERALCHARKLLCKEAGFSNIELYGPDWTSVAVKEEEGHTRRPRSVFLDEREQEVTVLGRITLPDYAQDRSYRVRLSSGDERTLVREPFGHWYVEEKDWVPMSERY